METAPMKAGELGQYVCVAHGGCLHSPHRTITADGVWVKQGPGGPFSSAHRDCYERWAASTDDDMATQYGDECPNRAAGIACDCPPCAAMPAKPAKIRADSLNWSDAYITLTNTDPVTRLPLMSSAGAHEMLRGATYHGRVTATGFLGVQVTVISIDGVFYSIAT
jgi:hypothetical protein